MDAVLNWLWQGALVALATAVLLRAIESCRASARYLVAWVALLSIVVLPLVPLVWPVASPMWVDGGVSTRVDPLVSMPIGWWTSSTIASGLWTLWFGVCAGRLAAALLALRRAKRQCRDVPPDLEARLPYWTQVRTRGRRTRIVVSDCVRSAAVLGGRSPVIAVAPALLDHLGDEELDRVLIHEWAHVQRRDDLANLVQLCVRVVAGWHPAAWWVNRQLHLEREVACDETVVALTGSAKRYAACLAKLASLPATPVGSLPAVAALSTSGVRRRIIRILAQPHPTSPRMAGAIAIGAGLAIVVLALTVGAVRFIDAASSSTEAGAVEPTVPAAASSANGSIEMVQSATSDQIATPRRTTARRARHIPPRSDRMDTTVAGNPDSSAIPVSPESATRSRAAEQPPPAVISRPTVPPAAFVLSMPLDPDAPDAPAPAGPAPTAAQPVSPWSAAADGGVAVGRASQRAGVATAGFFSRFGRKIAGSF